MKTALVTGGSRGIGAAVCRALAREGYRVFINYNTTDPKALAAEIGGTAVKCDVRDSAQVRGMFGKIGSVDVLVNNAGIAQQKLFTDITDSDWRDMRATHLDGTFFCCREALRSMIRNHSGSIINISSMWGQTGGSCEVHYSAVKAGIIGLTKALAKEVAPSGVRVNCVAPGIIETDMLSGFTAEELGDLRAEVPLGRLGSAEDIADAVVFLASEKASYITGQVLAVNGGVVI